MMVTHVQVLLSEGCSAASVAGCLEGFETINTLNSMKQRCNQPLFRVQTVAATRQAITCSGHISLTPDDCFATAPQADLIIVPGFLFRILQLLPTLTSTCEWLRHTRTHGAHLAGMCTGAFVLAEAGLLNHRRATTHWAFADAFAQRYPQVRLMPDQVVTDDDNLHCSGGATGGNDLMLYLLRKYGNAELANECAKKMLIDTRQRSQTPYTMMQRPRHHEDQRVHRIQDWLEAHFSEAFSLEEVARSHGLSLRQFMRCFKQATGCTPGTYVKNLRIEQAKFLLETRNDTIDAITREVGYEDGNSFRRLFRERVGITPTTYRQKFRP